jgi:zinc protease
LSSSRATRPAKQALGSDAASPIRDDGENQQLLADDQVIGTLRLNIAADKITVTPVAEVFAR